MWFQEEDVVANETAKRERARLREMQRVKKQKIQEILDDQNAAIEADMVCFPNMNWYLIMNTLPLHIVNDLIYLVSEQQRKGSIELSVTAN